MSKKEDVRFQIMESLIQKKQPMTLTEIADDCGLREPHVHYHMKELKELFLIIELENKKYTCQPFLIDQDILDDLNSLMKIIVKIIQRELETPDDTTTEKIVKSIIANLETFIRSFSVELFE